MGFGGAAAAGHWNGLRSYNIALPVEMAGVPGRHQKLDFAYLWWVMLRLVVAPFLLSQPVPRY